MKQKKKEKKIFLKNLLLYYIKRMKFNLYEFYLYIRNKNV